MSQRLKTLLENVKRISASRAVMLRVLTAILAAHRAGTLLVKEWCHESGNAGCLLVHAAAVVQGAPSTDVFWRFADEDYEYGTAIRPELSRILGLPDADICAIYCAWDLLDDSERRSFIAHLKAYHMRLSQERDRERIAAAISRTPLWDSTASDRALPSFADVSPTASAVSAPAFS